MAIIPLSFTSPGQDGLTTLHIYEAPTADSPFLQIDSTTDIGTFPGYITEFATDKATNANYWFAIQWEGEEDGKQVFYGMSAPLQGGTASVVSVISERVLLRSPGLNRNVVIEEAEGVIQEIFSRNPYEISLSELDYVQLSALTDLVLAGSLYTTIVERTSGGTSYTAGMLSETVNSKSTQMSLDTVAALEERALRRLGIGGARVAAIAEKLHANKLVTITGAKQALDTSRLLAIQSILTETFAIKEI